MAIIGRIFSFSYENQIFFIVGDSEEHAIERLVDEASLKRDKLELYCAGDSFSVESNMYLPGIAVTLEIETEGQESWPPVDHDAWLGVRIEPDLPFTTDSPESCGGLSDSSTDTGEYDSLDSFSYDLP